MAAPQPEEVELPQVVNLSQVDVENVQAELVRVSQSSIEQLTAEEVDLNTSAVGVVHTDSLKAHQAILGIVTSLQANMQECVSGGVRAESLSFHGKAGLALGSSVEAQDVDALVVAGTNLRADNIRTGILIAREVQGNVTTMVDSRTALLAGLVGGAVTGLIMLAGKLLYGRKK